MEWDGMGINMKTEIDFINSNGIKAARKLIESGEIVDGVDQEKLITLIQDHDLIIESGGFEAAIKLLEIDPSNELIARAVKNLS